MALIFGSSFGDPRSHEAVALAAFNADRLDFLNATGTYAGGSLGGLNNVDLWIGGLAEKIMPFGGMLGSTFNFVFEVQLEKLQDGDRFYYLQRLDGLHLLSRNGEQHLRQGDRPQRGRRPSALGRVLHPGPHSRGRPEQAVEPGLGAAGAEASRR